MPLGKEGISPIVASIFVLAITVSGIVIVLNVGMPAITRAKENSLFTESRQNMKLIDGAVDSVVYGGEGTSRKLTMDVTDGSYLFNSSADDIIFQYKMETDFLPVGLCKKPGDMKIKTYGVGRVLDLRFDKGSGNTTQDCSQYGNDGTLEPNETYGPDWTQGKFGKALEFDGVDDYVEVPDEPSLDITQEITISCWIKTSAATGAAFVDKQSGGGSGYRFTQESGVLEFGIYAGDINGGYTELNGQTDIVDGGWHHVVGTWDGETMIVYVDGREDGTASQSAIATNNLDVDIGVQDDSKFFNGKIDEVRIYDRALSASTIKELYQGGSAGNARKLEITLPLGNMNLTNQVRFGSGTHQIFLKNKGYSNDETQLEVRRV